MAKTSNKLIADIQYRILPVDPAAHLFEVELAIAQPDPEGQQLKLPAWIPGSYMIRDFARHIVQIEAFRLPLGKTRAGSRAAGVPMHKLDKHTWQLPKNSTGGVLVRYQVYAWDLSVRGAHLDETHGFFNGTSVFLAVVGQTNAPVGVEILPPAGKAFKQWRLATTMPSAGAKDWTFGAYQAADYDELIDHPIEMGEFQNAGFKAGGAHHELVITGAEAVDLERLIADIKPVCEAQARLFEPKTGRTPVERYLFMTMAVGQGYGGLEHRSSTALICKRADLPFAGMKGQPDGYRTFLGLVSHEYFHTWNIKRIKPAAFAPYELDKEAYTDLLWVFEGFTSYYDDLMLARTGIVAPQDYLDLVAQTITRIEGGAGRRLQSVAASSFDAWTKFYRQDENAPNSIVSYYGKGALVAMALDLTIRLKSKGKRSLDDVMRLMWTRIGKDFERKGKGIAEDQMPGLIREATGLRLDKEVAQWAYGTEDPPLDRLLRSFGVKLTREREREEAVWLGCRLNDAGGNCRVTHVLSDGPAHRAGLAAGDVIIALDGLRIDSEKTLTDLLARREAGTPSMLHLFRADCLMIKSVQAEQQPQLKAKLAFTDLLKANFLGPLRKKAAAKNNRKTTTRKRVQSAS